VSAGIKQTRLKTKRGGVEIPYIRRNYTYATALPKDIYFEQFWSDKIEQAIDLKHANLTMLFT